MHAAGALFYVDGVHATAHVVTDVPASGADFWVCSPYKFLGPHLGVLGARPETLEPLRPAKLLPSSDAVPERFELGTLPYELLAGTTAAVEFLAGLDRAATGDRRARLEQSYAALEAHEDELLGVAGAPAPSAARGHRAQQRGPAYAHPALHGGRPSRRRTYGSRWPTRGSTRPPATSTPGRRATTSGWDRRVACGSGWRPTPTTPTSRGSSRRSPR